MQPLCRCVFRRTTSRPRPHPRPPVDARTTSVFGGLAEFGQLSSETSVGSVGRVLSAWGRVGKWRYFHSARPVYCHLHLISSLYDALIDAASHFTPVEGKAEQPEDAHVRDGLLYQYSG